MVKKVPMKFEDDILNELQLLSPVLARLKKTIVFSVPEGYFESIGNAILIAVKNKADLTNNAASVNVPEGYFENLPVLILNKIKAQQKKPVEEEQEVLPASLQTIQKVNVFKVAQTYFENLSATVLEKIKAAEGNTEQKVLLQAFLNGLPQINPFKIPEGYFENLPAAVLAKINLPLNRNAEEEVNELSPFMQSLQRVNVFEVPEGYFNSNDESVMNAVKPVSARVVKMPERKLFLRYAAAAVVAGAMALGVYKYTDKHVVTTSQVPDVSFAVPDSSVEKGKNMNESEFNAALNNLSKEDITLYLEKNGSDEDITSLTNNADINDLPGKDDYLLDEKTLEDYLNKIKFQN
jgi:hypothetical protein